MFESSVISYGDKTISPPPISVSQFESSVISYGDKTTAIQDFQLTKFESSVISYGDKTHTASFLNSFSLRVV